MSEYTPLCDLPTLADTSVGAILLSEGPPLIWEYHTPPSIDTERLVVNRTMLERYQRIAAVSTSIVVDYQGETTEFTPGIGGINADGSAIASKTGVLTKADRSKNDVLDPYDIPNMFVGSYGRATLLHSLNKAEIGQNVAGGMRNGSKSREHNYAKQLDISLRESFRKGSREHLVERMGKLRYIDYAAFSVWGGTIAEQAIISHEIAPMLAPAFWASFQMLYTAINSIGLKKQTGSNHLSDKRWSIFYGGHQSDRYLALNGLSRVSKLISARA